MTTSYEPQALETLYEDILRLDPWQRLGAGAILVFAMPEANDATYVLALSDDPTYRNVTFYPDLDGLRLHLDSRGNDPLALQTGHERTAITVALDDEGLMTAIHRPGLSLDHPDEASLATLERLFTVFRKILRNGDAVPAAEKRGEKLLLPTWRIHPLETESLGLVAYRPYADIHYPAPVTDEFTLARLARLPKGSTAYELAYFYLPEDHLASAHIGPGEPLPVVVFLVNLDLGVIEWNTILLAQPNWRKQMLQQLYQWIFSEGARPAELIVGGFEAYRYFEREWTRAGIHSHCSGDPTVSESLIGALDLPPLL